MQFGILGPLEVLGDDGHPVDLGARKQRAVLALLIVAGGRVVSLDRLVDELWAEDEPPAQATLSLQSYVARLRRLLEPGRDPKTPSRLIVSRSPGWSLVLTGHGVDATRFEELAGVGRARLASGAPAAAAAALVDALALWRGEALAEFASLPTAAAETVRLTELRAAAMEDLLAAKLELGAAAEVVAEAELLLVEHPYRERLWQELVLGLYRSGRQADALEAVARARRRLADDLGLDPGRELRDLEAAVLRQDEVLDRPSRSGQQATIPASSPRDVMVDASIDGGVVGRDREQARLRDVVAALADGRGHVVLVHGPAGIGKSTLVNALVAMARPMAVAASGTAVDADPAPAYWPWVAILREISDQLGTTALGEHLGEHAQFVAVVDPVLGRSLGVAPPERLAWAELDRTRLLHGVADGMQGLARTQPVLLALDDAQWADAASVELLAAVADRSSAAPVVVVVAYRDDEMTNTPLEPVLSRLRTAGRVVDLALDGLDRAAVAAQLRAMCGASDDEVVDALLDRTGGNPLFLAELVRMLTSERALQPERVRTDAVPPVVHDVLERRLRRLPEQTNAVLAAAAVMGREFDVGALAEVLAMDGEALLEALDSAIVSGLVDDVDDASATLRFSHDLIRETLYDGVTGLRRARIHARVADALAVRPGTSALSLAHHFRLAAPALDPAVVVPRLVTAAAEAVDVLAYEQARVLLEQALRLSNAMRPGTARDDEQLDLHVRLGVIEQTLHGEASPVVGAHFEELVSLVGRMRITAAAVPGIVCAATGLLTRGRIDDIVGFADDVERRADPADRDVIAAVAAYMRSLTWLQLGRHLDALDELRRGLEHCALSPMPPYDAFEGWDVELGMRQYACITCGVTGDVRAAEDHLRKSRQIAARAGRAFTTLYVDHTETYLAVMLREPARAGAVATSMGRTATSLGFRTYAANARAVSGWARTLAGDLSGLADLEAVTRDAGGTAANGTAPTGTAPRFRDGYLHLLHAQALLVAGRSTDALGVADAAIADAGPQLMGPVSHELLLVRARAMAALGLEGAAEAARVAAAVAAERGATVAAAEARALLSAPVAGA